MFLNMTFNFQAYGLSLRLAANIIMVILKTGVHQETLCKGSLTNRWWKTLFDVSKYLSPPSLSCGGGGNILSGYKLDINFHGNQQTAKKNQPANSKKTKHQTAKKTTSEFSKNPYSKKTNQQKQQQKNNQQTAKKTTSKQQKNNQQTAKKN